MNAGSSSVKFAVYEMSDPPQKWLHGKVDRIGVLAAVGHRVHHMVNHQSGLLGVSETSSDLLDQTKNASGAPVISGGTSRVAIRVIRTDEELMIAKAVGQILDATLTTPVRSAEIDP